MSKVRRARRAHKAASQESRTLRAIERAQRAQERMGLEQLHAEAERMGNMMGFAVAKAVTAKLERI